MGRCFCSYGRTTTWAMPRNMVNFIEPPPSHFHRQMLADTWAWPFFVHPIMQAQILVGEKCPQNWFIVTIEEGLLISLATPEVATKAVLREEGFHYFGFGEGQCGMLCCRAHRKCCNSGYSYPGELLPCCLGRDKV